MTRVIVIAAVAAVVAGCASPGGTGGVSIVQTASVGGWQLQSERDKISGAESTSVKIPIRQAIYNNGVRYGFASGSLICTSGKPMVAVFFDFPVGATGTSVLGYRFDEKPGKSIGAKFFNTSSPYLTGDDAVEFIRLAEGSNSLYVKVSSPVGTAEVTLSGPGKSSVISEFTKRCHAKQV